MTKFTIAVPDNMADKRGNTAYIFLFVKAWRRYKYLHLVNAKDSIEATLGLVAGDVIDAIDVNFEASTALFSLVPSSTRATSSRLRICDSLFAPFGRGIKKALAGCNDQGLNGSID